MKLRIKHVKYKNEDYYYPERKGWFFWKRFSIIDGLFEDRYGFFEFDSSLNLYYTTEDGAKKFVEQTRAMYDEKNNFEKVV